MRRFVMCAAAVLAAVPIACSSPEGTGTVRVTTWGESLIEDGLASDLFPKDGWSVKYTRFLVALRAVTFADQDHAVGASLARPLVFDMTKKGDKLLAAFDLAAKPWPHVSYQLGPITSDAAPGVLATDADVAALQRDGATLHVEGTATAPTGDTKSFSWSFPTATLYEDCHGEHGGKEVEGVVVTKGGTQEVQITLHGDHLFYDDLQSEEAVPRFQALANADADRDGNITLEELDAVPLYTIPPELGSYGTGALGNVNTLGEYERTLARTIGHYRGEGSCNSKNPK